MQHNKVKDAVFNPTVRLYRLVFPADVQQTMLIKEVAPEIRMPGVDQQDLDTLNIKEEEEDPWTSLDVKKETVTTVFPADVQKTVLIKEEAPEICWPGVDQQDPNTLNIKEEEEDPQASLEREQLCVKQEIDDTRLALTVIPLKSEDDEEKPLFQVENGALPNSISADQMKAATSGEDCGADITRNPDLNTHEEDFNSSETEVSEDDKDDEYIMDPDFQLKNLSDSGSEPEDNDKDWKESRALESGVKSGNNSCSFSKSGKQFHMTCQSKMSTSCLVKQKCFRLKKTRGSSKTFQSMNKSFSCDECGKTFHKEFQRNIHMRVHTGQKPFACDQCGRTFGDKSHLNRHIRVHTREKPFACDICGRMFGRQSHLSTHMRIHTGEKPYVCDQCGRKFGDKSHLNYHIRVHTGEKPFACDQCGQRFGQKSVLNIHIRVHTGEKPFACDYCKRRFGQKSNLITHMRIHTGHKPFNCDFCEQRFGDKSHLNYHMRIHTGEKPFACDCCERRFGQKSHLNYHMRVHTGQKPFACDHCEQKFGDKSHLNRHMRGHTGEKPFACDHCERKFAQKSHLNKHMKVHTEQKSSLSVNIKSAPKETQQFTQNLN